MRTSSSGSGKAYSPRCLEAALIALCPGPIEEDRWGASTHRGVLSGDDGLAYQPRWGYAVRDERRELEEAGEIPRARYLVRLARHGKSGKLHEQIYDRAELVSRQAENEAMRSGRDGSPRSDERGQEDASGSDVDNGTGDSEAIEEVLAFYREAQEALKDLPVKKVAEKEGEIRQQHKGALATLKDLGGRDPREAQEGLGYTREEKIYALLADFRDQLKRIPSDPKAVARTTEDFPVVAANSLDDFEEMARWLTEFASEMRRIVEGAVEGAKK